MNTIFLLFYGSLCEYIKNSKSPSFHNKALPKTNLKSGSTPGCNWVFHRCSRFIKALCTFKAMSHLHSEKLCAGSNSAHGEVCDGENL